MSYLATIDPEDLTPKQMRKLINSFRSESLMRHKRKKNRPEEDDEDDGDEDEDKENSDLVDLHREHKGDDKAPEVNRDDLPKGAELPGDEEEDETKEDKKKNKNKKEK